MEIPVVHNKRWKPQVFISREVKTLVCSQKGILYSCLKKNEKVLYKVIWDDVQEIF